MDAYFEALSWQFALLRGPRQGVAHNCCLFFAFRFWIVCGPWTHTREAAPRARAALPTGFPWGNDISWW